MTHPTFVDAPLNRWFYNRGGRIHRKRVASWLEPFRDCIVGQRTDRKGVVVNSIGTTKLLKEKFQLSLIDAMNLMVFLHGFPIDGRLRNPTRFRAGKILARRLVQVKPDPEPHTTPDEA